MKHALFFCLVSALFFATSLYAQKIDESLKAEAVKLKTAFKDDDVAALKATSVYTFSLDKNKSSITAREEDEYQYLALRSNATYVKKNYYSQESYIDSYSIKSTKGSNYPHNKFCGNYEQGDVFYSDAKVCAYQIKMELQGLSVLYQSSTVYNDPKYLTYAFFHDDVPAKERKIVLSIPDWAQIELVEMNFDGYDIKKQVTPGKNETTYTYEIANLESFPHDRNVPGHLVFLPHILILTKSFTLDGREVKVLSSADDLYKWYSRLTAKIKTNNESLKPIVDNLTKGLKTNEEKIKAIYYWVQDNIKYIAFEDGLAAFKPEDAHEVFYKRYGDCKGMANLTKDMLQLAGFDARLTWIGTDRIPYTYKVPSLAVNNHMICTVFDGNKKYILDATEKFNPFGAYAERIQGKEILIEDGDSYILSKVPEEPLENYLEELVWHYKIKNDTLEGNGKSTINGEYKKALLYMASSVKQEDLDKFLKSVIAGPSNPDGFDIIKQPDFDREKTLSISYDINLKNQLNRFDDELYLDLDFRDDFKESRMAKERKAPFQFGSKSFEKIRAELLIPQGYRLEHLPEAYHVKNEHFSFDMKYSLEANKIIYQKEIRILKNILPVSEFKNWNTAIDGLVKFYDDQIILKSNDK